MNKYYFNPAYAGLDRSLSVTAGLRSQWSQLPGAPKTQFVNAHLPLYALNGAAGFALVNDALGPFQRTSFTMSYNYVLSSEYGLFSGGFRLGGQRIGLDNTALITPDGFYSDQIFDHQDPILNESFQQGFTPVWSLGVYFAQNLFEGGITIDQLGGTGISAGGTNFNEHVTISAFGSYQYPITEQLSVEPNVFIKTDGTSTQLDIGVMGYFEQFIGGFSFRGYNANSIDALGVIAGLRVSNNVRVSYSFDLGLSNIRTFHDGTHEFLVHYNLNKPIRTGELPRIIYNPRFN